MATSISQDLVSLITQQAQTQGVPPEIALAVAQQESGISQWRANGSLVTGTSGEIGIFQIMPATAASLGVNPSDVNQNIQGGVSLLAQLFQKYGNWSAALSAYNSGSPTGSPSYASSVLSKVSSWLGVPSNSSVPDIADASASSSNGPLIIGGILGGVALLWWVLE